MERAARERLRRPALTKTGRLGLRRCLGWNVLPGHVLLHPAYIPPLRAISTGFLSLPVAPSCIAPCANPKNMAKRPQNRRSDSNACSLSRMVGRMPVLIARVGPVTKVPHGACPQK